MTVIKSTYFYYWPILGDGFTSDKERVQINVCVYTLLKGNRQKFWRKRKKIFTLLRSETEYSSRFVNKWKSKFTMALNLEAAWAVIIFFVFSWGVFVWFFWCHFLCTSSENRDIILIRLIRKQAESKSMKVS